jgi:hypothetical protein
MLQESDRTTTSTRLFALILSIAARRNRIGSQ